MKIMRIFNFFLKISLFLSSIKTIHSSFDDTLEDFLISEDLRDQTFDNNRDNNYFSQQYFPKINNQFNEKFGRNYPNIYGKNNRKIVGKDISVRIEKKLKKIKEKDKKQLNINTFFDLLFGQSLDSMHIRKRIKCGPDSPFSGPIYEMPNQERGESQTLEEMNDRANRARKCRLKKLRRLIRKKLLSTTSTTTETVIQAQHFERKKCFTFDEFLQECNKRTPRTTMTTTTTTTTEKPVESVENLEKTTENPTEVDVCQVVNMQFRVKCPTMGSTGDITHTNEECEKLQKLHGICFPELKELEVRSGVQSVCEQILILNQKCSEMSGEAKRNTIECENIDVLHAKCFKQFYDCQSIDKPYEKCVQNISKEKDEKCVKIIDFYKNCQNKENPKTPETCDKLRQIYMNCLNGTQKIMIKSIECETIEEKFEKCLNVTELTESKERTTTKPTVEEKDPLLKSKCISKKCLNKRFGDEKVEEHTFEAPDDFDYPELNVTLNPLIECKALETEIQSLTFNEKNFLKSFGKTLEELNETNSVSEELRRHLRQLEEKGKKNSQQRRELFKNFMNFCGKCENSSKCDTTTTTKSMESMNALEEMISEELAEQTTTTETTISTTDSNDGMESGAEIESTTETTTMRIIDEVLSTEPVFINEVTSYEPTVQETTATEEILTTTESMGEGGPEIEITTTEIETTATEIETTATEIETTATEIETTATEIETTATEIETTATEIETTATEIETTTTEMVTTVDDGKDEEDVSIVNYNVLGMNANDKNANNVDKYLRKANPLALKSIFNTSKGQQLMVSEKVSKEETTESQELSSEKTLKETKETIVKQTESEMNSEKDVESKVKGSETEDTLSTDESESEEPEEDAEEVGNLVSEVIQTII